MNLDKLIIDILLDYDHRNITKKELIKRGGNRNMTGMVDFSKAMIYVVKDIRLYERQLTLLHEFAHVYLEQYLGREPTEEQVEKQANLWMEKLYGG